MHDRVHEVVQIAGMAGGTKVAMHTYTEAVTAHVRSRASCAPAYAGVRPWAASLRSSILRDRWAGQGCASPLPCDVGRALDLPRALATGLALTGATAGCVATSRPGRRVRLRAQVVGGRRPWARTALRAISMNSFLAPDGPPSRRVTMMVSRPRKYVTSSVSISSPYWHACSVRRARSAPP